MKWLLVLVLLPFVAKAQDSKVILQEAVNLEKQFKEAEALAKYAELVKADSSNMDYLLKCTELNCSIGARERDKATKQQYYDAAGVYVNKAYSLQPESAAANYLKALVAGKMTEVTEKDKETVDYVRQIKVYADKALTADADYAKANYIEGKWHYEMVTLSFAKRAAVRTLFGKLPKASIDSAIYFMNKAITKDIYFTPAYLDLAKAYEYDHQPAKETEILNKLVKLPNRKFDDAALKQEGKAMMAKVQ